MAAALLTHPHRLSKDLLSGFSPFRRGFQFGPLMPDPAGAVHVAVGKSVDKTAALLQWTFSMFPGHEICLLHVHRPSLLIPTLLGKLPASQANPATVEAFRNKEREETMKLLSTYLLACSRSRVKASVITIEANEVQKGIVNLVNLHTVRKLVVGAIADSMKGKKSSCKGCHVSKHVPSYCETWFVNKGKLIWTKQASASSSIHLPSCQLATACTHNLRSQPLNSGQKEAEVDIRLSTITQCIESSCDRASSSLSLGSCSVYTTSSLSSKTEEEGLCIQLAELKGEVDESKDEAYRILQEQKHYEVEALEAFNKEDLAVISKVNALQSAHESKLRSDAEEELRLTIQEQEKLYGEREKVSKQLEMTMRSIAILNTHAQEAEHRHEQVAEEWKHLRASIASLRKEKQRLQKQKIEATRWLDRWRSHKQCENAHKDEFIALMGDDASVLPEFLLSDLEAATCNFSESFRIGKGGYGIVYKGEMMERTVAVKKMHSYNMLRQPEFHQEVQILGKICHPHLVELVGTCPESWLLVSEYMPGGSLQEHLNRNDANALNWKTRARIVFDIASALLFLHSFRPKKIIHGNLKPGNLLLDSENRCKISDYADHMLTTGLTLRCPSFRGCSSTGVCLYTDPEYYRNGVLTHKSDIYSFGVIILQLVTRKTDGGIVGEVRRAFSSGKVATILDSSAGEWSTYVGRRLLELGLQFCQSNSRDRPELSASLVKELECMPFLEEQTVPSFFLCPILREIMHDPQVASDGFTYEGEAIRGWLENGHETSPMTNLKLSDTNLTPNHSLRLAIQDWIANLKITS